MRMIDCNLRVPNKTTTLFIMHMSNDKSNVHPFQSWNTHVSSSPPETVQRENCFLVGSRLWCRTCIVRKHSSNMRRVCLYEHSLRLPFFCIRGTWPIHMWDMINIWSRWSRNTSSQDRNVCVLQSIAVYCRVLKKDQIAKQDKSSVFMLAFF